MVGTSRQAPGSAALGRRAQFLSAIVLGGGLDLEVRQLMTLSILIAIAALNCRSKAKCEAT